jgi:hypothetical protein
VRCIVQSLTDEQNGDLFEELRRDNMRIIQHDDDSDDDEVRPLFLVRGLRDALVVVTPIFCLP